MNGGFGNLALALAAMMAACSLGHPCAAQAAPGSAPARLAPNDYGDPKTWLCLPGRKDACGADQSTTIVAADGSMTVEGFHANPHASIDCFYLYPTASTEPTGNSDMTPGPSEIGVVWLQLARFGSVCRLYAPLYRQVTVAGATGGKTTTPVDRALPYADVRDAWAYYLAHDNKGRGVVLIGHSQGSDILSRLIANEIDGKPVGARLVSAILAGLPSRPGNGVFKTMGPCVSADQTHCEILYSSFRAASPPGPSAFFARSGAPYPAVACVNPAALEGGSGELKAYLPSRGLMDPGPPWVKGGPDVHTSFVEVPGLLSAQCVRRGNFQYLAISVHGDPSRPRVSDIVGDMQIGGKPLPDWGLHGIDLNLAMGNLVDIVGQQAKAYHRRQPRS
jgi:hypothetical protein